MMRHKCFLRPAMALLLSVATTWTVAQGQNLVEVIEANPDMSLFYYSLIEYPEIVAAINGTQEGQFTVFVPTNEVIQSTSDLTVAMFESYFWLHHLDLTMQNHIVPERALGKFALFDGSVTALPTLLGEELSIKSFLAQINEAKITSNTDILASNGVIHTIDQVMFPSAFADGATLANLEKQPELIPLATTEGDPSSMEATSLKDVIDFVGGRAFLEEFVPEGRTFLGCEQQALASLSDYLPLDSKLVSTSGASVLPDEFLNPDLREATRTNFVLYNMLQRNFYVDTFPTEGNAAITLPAADCGHMIISNIAGRICFNNACVLTDDANNLRTYLASNGVGYVTDKCLVCPGVAMLVQYAAQFAGFGTDDVHAFFQATGWNVRDLTANVGTGRGPITLFATKLTSWETLGLEESLKFRTNPAWKPHLQEVLLSMMVQGSYAGEDLKRIYDEEGGNYKLNTLNGESLDVGYDAVNDFLLIDGKPIFVVNMKGVDGMLHITEHVPKPNSLTTTLYNTGHGLGKEAATFMGLIDQPEALTLRNTLELVTPLTTLYVQNDVWRGVFVNSENVTGDVLENHILPDIYSCETLSNMPGMTVTSLNGASWTVSVDQTTKDGSSRSLPCFVPSIDPMGMKACIIECDIPAKNGIGHMMGMLLGQPGVVIPKPPSSAPSPAPIEPDPNAPSASPTIGIDSIDLEGCFRDLSGADTDGDGAVRRHEFYNFVAAYGVRKCYEPGGFLTPQQVELFTKYACKCLEEDDAEEDCCEGTSAFIDIQGTMISGQRAYKTGLCEGLERQLIDWDCAYGGRRPTPAPTRLADRMVPPSEETNTGDGDSGATVARGGVGTLTVIGLVSALLLL